MKKLLLVRCDSTGINDIAVKINEIVEKLNELEFKLKNWEHYESFRMFADKKCERDKELKNLLKEMSNLMEL